MTLDVGYVPIAFPSSRAISVKHPRFLRCEPPARVRAMGSSGCEHRTNFVGYRLENHSRRANRRTADWQERVVLGRRCAADQPRSMLLTPAKGCRLLRCRWVPGHATSAPRNNMAVGTVHSGTNGWDTSGCAARSSGNDSGWLDATGTTPLGSLVSERGRQTIRCRAGRSPCAGCSTSAVLSCIMGAGFMGAKNASP